MTASPLPSDPLARIADEVARLENLPLDEQAAVFETIHRVITDALASTAPRVESNNARPDTP